MFLRRSASRAFFSFALLLSSSSLAFASAFFFSASSFRFSSAFLKASACLSFSVGPSLLNRASVPSPKPLILVSYEGNEKSKSVSATDGSGEARVNPKVKVAATTAGVHLFAGFAACKEVEDCVVGCFMGLNALALPKSIAMIEKTFMVSELNCTAVFLEKNNDNAMYGVSISVVCR